MTRSVPYVARVRIDHPCPTVGLHSDTFPSSVPRGNLAQPIAARIEMVSRERSEDGRGRESSIVRSIAQTRQLIYMFTCSCSSKGYQSGMKGTRPCVLCVKGSYAAQRETADVLISDERHRKGEGDVSGTIGFARSDSCTLAFVILKRQCEWN
jgi:hypothetical protein